LLGARWLQQWTAQEAALRKGSIASTARGRCMAGRNLVECCDYRASPCCSGSYVQMRIRSSLQQENCA
jgi:hypothetical protein